MFNFALSLLIEFIVFYHIIIVKVVKIRLQSSEYSDFTKGPSTSDEVPRKVALPSHANTHQNRHNFDRINNAGKLQIYEK